ncbi:TPA: hypothetical protein ACH3X2_013852 [Trebouxia sp. C0005]
MAPAKYKGLGFPDIVQLAFPDTACQLIAGCSSTGLLAVWSIRGDLLMAHCHPLFMVQSIQQPPDQQLASQTHSPEVLVVLAKTQQHPNSQQHGRKPLQSLVALVLTHDNLFVGANIGPKDVLATTKVAGQLAVSSQSQGIAMVWDMQQVCDVNASAHIGEQSCLLPLQQVSLLRGIAGQSGCMCQATR